ncbi:hypothetical protein AAHC03_024320 [Spirometra sp. Aus1]
MQRKWICLLLLALTTAFVRGDKAFPLTGSSPGFSPLSYVDGYNIDDLQLPPLEPLDEGTSPPPTYLFLRLYRDLVSEAMEKGSQLAGQALPHQKTWVNASLVGLPFGDGGFRWYSDAGFLLRPDSNEVKKCPWDLHQCDSDEFFLRFGFLYLEDVDASVPPPNTRVHLLTLTSQAAESAKEQSSISFFYEPRLRRILAVGTFFTPLEAILSTETAFDWITVSMSVKPLTGEVDLIVESADASAPGVPIISPEAKMMVMTNGDVDGVSLRVGPPANDYSTTTFLQVLERDLLLEETEVEEYGDGVLMGAALSNRNNHRRRNPVSIISFEDASSFVRYDFHNWIREPTSAEKVVIEFVIPKGVTSGLLWFVEDKTYKRYIVLKDSRLYYKYIKLDQTTDAKWTLTEEIAIKEPLKSDVKHKLIVHRINDLLRLTINKLPAVEKAVSERVPLIPVGAQVYLGGTEDASKSTLGEVDRNFQGKVASAQVSLHGRRDDQVDLMGILQDPNWTGRVHPSRGVQYEYHVNKRPPQVLSPTSSSRSYAGITLSRTPIPVTYMGTQNSVVRFDTWDFSVYRSFEIDFRTFEPNGVLFFVGPDREHTDFVCVELFDGNVYFVYGIGNHYRHVQLNPQGVKVNTGTAHRVYVERTPEHRFIVKYNGMEVDVDQGTSAHQAEFSSYTYIGSIDQPTRLPWVVWSRENFAGCINSIRINDDKFLDPASRMNQHTDLSRGIQFGVCKAPDPRCTRKICGGGQCHERSHPFFEPMNFACDCSASDKTFREGVEDIRRSEVCNRDSPVVQFDGETVVLLDFERQMNTLTTHTDDIDIQFRTKSPDAPIFNAVSTVERQFLRVDLQAGRIKVTTNINRASNPGREQSFILDSIPLNDDQWHTLRLRRRAQHLYISVDNRNEKKDMLIVEIPKGVFNQIAQQIYVGGQAPADYAPPPFNNMAGFLPPGPKFVGEMRNFYWNQYDFFGTPRLPTKYTTEILTPRLELPDFPSWPREPTYSITCNPGLQWATLNQPLVSKDAGDMWIVEFKTQYDGVLLHARDVRTSAHFSLIILKGRLHFVYSVGGVTGVHEFVNGPSAANVADNNWHRVSFGIDRVKGRFILLLDDAAPELVGYRLRQEEIDTLTFHFGGVENKWREIYNIIRTYAPTSLPMDSESQPPAISGCIGGFSSRADRFNIDLLKKYDPVLRSYPDNQLVRGYCRDVFRCTSDYCSNGGTCYIYGKNELRCNCSGTGFTGSRCDIRITTCPDNYCLNGGTCKMIGSRPVCSCASPIFYGERCELSPCDDPNFCQNGGRCRIVNNNAVCDCRRTGYTGPRCSEPVCPRDYCRNNGICRVNEYTNEPYCDCSNTGYGGPYCDQRVCEAGFCRNNGVCRIENNRPVCDCRGTGYGGPVCDQPICSADYCLNNGRCVARGDKPYCDCSQTGFEGPRCEQSLCRPDLCLNGGICRLRGGVPYCDCTYTDYEGSRCEQPICRPGYCHNNGVCRIEGGRPVCDCRNSGYEGPRCDQPICRPGYCLNNGVCRIEGGRPVCDCRNSGYGGSRCEQPLCQPGYCLNNGVCRIEGGRPVCDCRNSGYEGPRCEQPLCQPGYCLNNGVCRIEGGRPVCDCRNTGYEGPRCEQSICRPGYCLNNGLCTIENGRPVCDCRSTGHTGERCEQPICRPGVCQNNGRCIISADGPVCDCRGTGYEGPNCERPLCPDNFCLNGGRCVIQGNRPVCECQHTLFTGQRCEQPICLPGYCENGGRCTVSPTRQPICDCSGTTYSGERCTYPLCPPGYCANGGRCFVRPGSTQPECDCSGTGFEGQRCQAEICPPNYCQNGGQCRLLPGGQKFCECTGTGYTGSHCQDPICSPGYCKNGGTCRVQNGRPYCDCPPQYWGPQCNMEVCTPGYCHHGGICSPGEDRRPHCRCPDGYDGDRCERPKQCPPGYCYYGGICTMQGGIPHCDCRQTDYEGPRCESPKTCPSGYCQNGGRCSVVAGTYVCDCTGTGFRGPLCTESIACPSDFCLYGGICSVLPGGDFSCDCSRTGRSGPNCEGDTNGVYIDYDKTGYLVYNLVPPLQTTEDNVTVGFKTYFQTGTILDFLTSEGKYWSVKVRDGRLVMDVNGAEYSYRPLVNDGAYHLVNIERRGDSMVVTLDNSEMVSLPMSNIINLRDGSITYSTLYVGANNKKSNIFRGAIGGLYWNGRYPIDEAKGGLQVVTGEVVYVFLPSFMLPDRKPVIECPPDFCFNGGICYVDKFELKCDCRGSGWHGPRCERQSRGFIKSVEDNGAYVIIPIQPPETTNLDRMRVAFQTYLPDGPIARFVSPDGKFYEIYMKGQQVFVSMNNENIKLISAPYQQCDDGKMHVITMERKGNQYTWHVDGHRTIFEDTSVTNQEGVVVTNEIILGADRSFEETFTGVIGAFDWNGVLLINDQGRLSSNAKIMAVPGKVAGSKDDVVIVLMPHLLVPPKPTPPDPQVPFPTGIPPHVYGGGIVMTPGGGGGLIVPPVGYGGGASGIFAGAGPLLVQAGGLGYLGAVNPLIAGLLIFLLPLLSALIWACWRCKPGCCPCCMGAGALGGVGGGKVSSTLSRIKSAVTAPPEKEPMLASKNAYAVGSSPFINGGVRAQPHAGDLDLTDRYQMIGRTDDTNLLVGPNVYAADDMKVDCCVLSYNSKYVVTGSASGPPQVWDMETGEPCKVMDGEELGCNDLHLACNDELLVGQVVDDITTAGSSKMHRLQLWNFATGARLEMPSEIVCSASCVSNEGVHIIAARHTPSGPSILVWDLSGNQLAREVPYAPLNPRSVVSYINITPEDRLVVAGFSNPDDDQAYFMVFDLAAHTAGVVQPNFVVFDAQPEATEILNNEEAVTGTRKGELVVWNLLTGQPVRQIEIAATLEGGNRANLPPHTGIIHAVTLSADKRYLVTGAQDRLVRVWAMPEERLIHTLEGHADDVLSVTISVDSEMIVSGSWDGSIRVWRTRDGSQMCWFTSNIEVLQVKLSRDKRAIVGLGERNGHRKLIMMQIIRNRTCTSAVYPPGGGGFSPSSPHMLPDNEMV